MKNRKSLYSIILTVAVMAVVFASQIWDSGTITSNLSNEALGVADNKDHAVFVMFQDIESAELRTDLEWGTAVEITETRNSICGQYENEEFGLYDLFVYADVSSCIVVRYSEGVLVFNTSSDRATETFYNKLTAQMEGE